MSTQTSLPIVDHTPTYRSTVLQALAKFRREWEEIANGESLLDMSASVGLVLADVAEYLEMTPQERYVFLGKMLLKDIEHFKNQQVNLVEQ